MLTENKFSKYLLYAIGEIFLVVIGILIALQVNNQNENRKSKSQANIWRKDIVEDLIALVIANPESFSEDCENNDGEVDIADEAKGKVTDLMHKLVYISTKAAGDIQWDLEEREKALNDNIIDLKV